MLELLEKCFVYVTNFSSHLNCGSNHIHKHPRHFVVLLSIMKSDISSSQSLPCFHRFVDVIKIGIYIHILKKKKEIDYDCSPFRLCGLHYHTFVTSFFIFENLLGRKKKKKKESQIKIERNSFSLDCLSINTVLTT